MPTRRDWDLVLDDSTIAYGFMLATSADGVQDAWRYEDAPVLPPRVMTSEEASDAQYPTQYQQVITQKDWRGGLGGVKPEDYAKDNKYADGLRTDGSFEAVVKLARALTDTSFSVTAPAGTTKGVAGMGLIGTLVTGPGLWLFRDSNVGGASPRVRGFVWSFTNRNWVDTSEIDAASQNVVPNGTVFAGNLYLPQWGLSDNTTARAYRYIPTDATTVTVSTLTPNDFYFLAVSADGRMWGGYRPTAGQRHHVYSSTDPTNTGAWTGPTAIGESAIAITALVPYRDGILICKENGIYSLDIRGTVIRVDPANLYDSLRDPNNFRNAINWNGKVLLPLGSGGMHELDEDGNIRDISFSKVAPDLTDIDGRVLSLAADADMVFALVEDGSTGLLLGAEYLVVNGKIDYRWHKLQTMTISTTAIDLYRQFMLLVRENSNGVYRRLFISRNGSETSTTSANEFMPRPNDRDDTYDGNTNATFDIVDIDFGYPSLLKEWQEVTLQSANLSSAAGGHTIVVQRSLDGGTFSNINATSSTFNTSASQTIVFDNATTGRRIRLRFNLLRGTTTTTSPEILQITIKGQVRQTPVKIHRLILRLGDGVVNLAGAREHRAVTKNSQLRTWNGQAASLILTSRDTAAAGIRVVSVPGTMNELGVYEGWHRRPYKLVSMAFQEVR